MRLYAAGLFILGLASCVTETADPGADLTTSTQGTVPTTLPTTSTGAEPTMGANTTATLGATSTTEATTIPAPEAGEVGYLGCSVTTDAVIGYHLVGGSLLWEVEGDYAGGALALWANRVGANQMWVKFQQRLDANTGTNTLWWELCTTEAEKGDDLEQGLAVLGELERRLVGSAIFVSGQPAYPDHVCSTSGADGPEAMAMLAAQLVETGRVQAGPAIGPLNETQTRDGCHANEAGRLLMGEQLFAFFDASST